MLRGLVLTISSWDQRICLRLGGVGRREVMDRVMVVCSKAGDGYFYGAVALGLLMFEVEMGLRFAIPALVGVAFNLLVYKIIKQGTRRLRPFEALVGMRFLVPPPDRFSFPSGHTATAFLMASVAVSVFPTVWVPAYGMAVLIGYARIYVGMHYPTDVIGGAVLGLGSAEVAQVLVAL